MSFNLCWHCISSKIQLNENLMLKFLEINSFKHFAFVYPSVRCCIHSKNVCLDNQNHRYDACVFTKRVLNAWKYFLLFRQTGIIFRSITVSNVELFTDKKKYTPLFFPNRTIAVTEQVNANWNEKHKNNKQFIVVV